MSTLRSVHRFFHKLVPASLAGLGAILYRAGQEIGWIPKDVVVFPFLALLAWMLLLHWFLGGPPATRWYGRQYQRWAKDRRIMAYSAAILIGAVIGGTTGAGWWKLFEMHRQQMARLKEKLPAGQVTTTDESKKATPPPQKHQTKLQDQVLALVKEIENWKTREDLAYSKLPVADTPQARYLANQAFQRQLLTDFTGTFGGKTENMLRKLEKCNADTSELKKVMALSNPYGAANIAFIVMNLKSAAHTIPEGQPECGTGAPHQGFGLKDTGKYTLSMGGASVSFYKEDLERSVGGMNVGRHSFKIYLRNGIFCVDAKIYRSFGLPLIDVVCNQVEPPSGWDTNYTDKAIEVVDANQVPMFQMIFENDLRIQINGVFPADNNQVLIDTPQGTTTITIDPEHPTPIKVPLKRLFKYPSWKYPHQYVD